MLHLSPPKKSILRLKHKTRWIHTFRFGPWKSFTSMNCCTFPIVVFFLLYSELRLLGFMVSSSDICFPCLSTQTKGENSSTCDPWVFWESWVCDSLLWCWLEKTFLSSWHTRPLLEAFHLNYSITLEVSRATNNKTKKHEANIISWELQKSVLNQEVDDDVPTQPTLACFHACELSQY